MTKTRDLANLGGGFIQTGTGAVQRTVESKLQDVVSVLDFIPQSEHANIKNGTSTYNATAAIQAAVAASSEVYFPSGTYKISSNLTIGADKCIVMSSNASLTVDTGVTLKLYCTFSANPNVYIFKGAGTVQGLGDVYPEWWGAVGDGTTNDQPAFQKAADCLTDHFTSVGSGTIHLQSKIYYLATTWTITQHSNAPINVVGTGTLIGQSRLKSSSSNTGACVAVNGQTGASSTVDFTLKGFAIIAESAGVGTGLVFNNNSTTIIEGLQESLVENIYVQGFKFGIIVRRTRLVNFRRVSVWQDNINGSLIANANICLKLENTGAAGGAFTGDMSFESCQFVNTKQQYSDCIVVESNNVNGPSNIAGVRFHQCIIYKGGGYSLKLVTNNTCEIGDVWITSCQFDDTTGIYVKTYSANDVIADVHISNCYFTASPSTIVRLDGAASPGRINCIGIDHCSSAGSGIAIEAGDATNLVVTNNRLSGCTAPTGAPLVFYNCNEVNVIGNSAGRFGPLATPGGFQNLVYFLGTGNRYVAIGNNSAGLATGTLINNTTGAAVTSFANNI